MDENVAVSARAGFDLVGNEAYAVFLQPFHGGGEIGDAERYVMQSLAAFGDEFGDGGIFRSGLQEFQAALAHGNHDQAHLFRGDGFFRRNGKAEFFIDCLRRRERFYGNAEMVDGEHSCHSAGLRPAGQPRAAVPTSFHFAPATISSTIVYGSRLCSATSAAYAARLPSLTCPRAFSSMASRSISIRRSCQL